MIDGGLQTFFFVISHNFSFFVAFLFRLEEYFNPLRLNFANKLIVLTTKWLLFILTSGAIVLQVAQNG